MDILENIIYWAGLVGSCAFVVFLLMQRFGAAIGQVRRAAGGRLRELAVPAIVALLAGSALLIRLSDGANTGGARPLLRVLVGFGATWLVARLIHIAMDSMIQRQDVSVEDNLRARTALTQYRVLERIAIIVVWGLGTAMVMWTFPGIRALGSGLLASAGIVGLVLGLAAQRTIGNFLAGIQIALTQPVRLDDAVVIEDEWGWIEDITTTYVEVKLWDERRLIVPFTTILEKPFQNWTRTRADIIGSVMLWTDHSVNVAEMRKVLQSIVESTDLWDGRVVVLQVVESSERAVQLRALVSAANSPRCWDLRCHVREKLLAYLAEEQAHALPRLRGELDSSQMTRPSSGARAPDSEGPPGREDASEVEVGGLPGGPRS
ncbi:Miniconductance mechanosensitive channel MscM precursor [Planctomycetes bacterium Poly30]|uniref:Miniconductance mechanosensitive channel MscM n=1 Tax=Saltatorellus ferox TaxID=2528018 RepID=A0A518ELP1_9BACT|nr:Miniconductance mechanosensitive channel MscM precursor [Planctomycetes bacterium Poly30]